MGATVAKASSIPDYNQDFPDFGTKVLETWGREGNLAREMANRLLLASGNTVEARRKDASDFEQAKELAAIKQKYAKELTSMRAASRDAANNIDVDGNGNWLLPPAQAIDAQTRGMGAMVGTTLIKGKPVGSGESMAPPAGSPQAVPYTQGGSSIPAPRVVPPPAPVGGPPAPAGLKPITLSSGKTVYADEQGNIVNVPK